MSYSRHLALALALLLAGCGFQLVGSLGEIDVTPPVYISAADRYTPFYLGVEQRLRNSGIATTEDLNAATSILAIRRDDTGQRVLSVSANNVPREYEVFYTVSYDLTVAGNITAVATDLTLTRDYTWNESQVLGKAREERIIRDDLATLLIDDFVRRAAGQR